MKIRQPAMNTLMILLRHLLVISTGAKEMQMRAMQHGLRMSLLAFKLLTKDQEKLESKFKTSFRLWKISKCMMLSMVVFRSNTIFKKLKRDFFIWCA